MKKKKKPQNNRRNPLPAWFMKLITASCKFLFLTVEDETKQENITDFWISGSTRKYLIRNQALRVRTNTQYWATFELPQASFQSEAKYEATDMKAIFYSHATLELGEGLLKMSGGWTRKTDLRGLQQCTLLHSKFWSFKESPPPPAFFHHQIP